MKLSERQLNRATLHRQLLLQRRAVSVPDAIRAVCALQAQSPASPYLALWNRIADFDPADLDRAFADHTVVKATLLRITLHAVAAADYPAFHLAMQPTLRAARLHDSRFTRTGLSVAEADALVPPLLEFAARAGSNAEFEAWVDEQVGVRPKPGVWWALRHYASLVLAPTGGPWSFGPRPSYVAARTVPHEDADEAMRHLVRRYLTAFGPASAQDIRLSALLYAPLIRAALDSQPDLVQYAGPGRAMLYDVPGGPLPAGDTPAPPRLLGMWDSILLVYADRRRIIPEPYRRLVLQSNGDCLPTVLVDGLVAGVWRPAPPDGATGIEVTAFHRLPDEVWSGLAVEAAALVAFLAAREPDVYRRYARWWDRLPAAEVRVLPG